MKRIYRYPDRGEFRLIRYVIKSGFLSGTGRCEICDVPLNRKHLSNVCRYIENEKEELSRILRIDPGRILKGAIIKAYFKYEKGG